MSETVMYSCMTPGASMIVREYREGRAICWDCVIDV